MKYTIESQLEAMQPEAWICNIIHKTIIHDDFGIVCGCSCSGPRLHILFNFADRDDASF